MHEMGVALEICRIAEQHVGSAGARFLTGVGLVVGDDAGVERSSLEFCLETLLAQPPFAGAAVHISPEAGDTLRVDTRPQRRGQRRPSRSSGPGWRGSSSCRVPRPHPPSARGRR